MNCLYEGYPLRLIVGDPEILSLFEEKRRHPYGHSGGTNFYPWGFVDAAEIWVDYLMPNDSIRLENGSYSLTVNLPWTEMEEYFINRVLTTP